MSVLKSKRRESKFETFDHCTDLRNELTNLALENFGYKIEKVDPAIVEKIKAEATELKSKNDKIDFFEYYNKQLLKYENSNNVAMAFLQYERTVFLSYCRELAANITAANSIYPNTLRECEERRIYQDRAIGDCYKIKSELQYIIDILSEKINIDRLLKYDDVIERQIILIKAWRKSDNIKFKEIKYRQDFVDNLTQIKEEKYTQLISLQCALTAVDIIKNKDKDINEAESYLLSMRSKVIADWKEIDSQYNNFYKRKFKKNKSKELKDLKQENKERN